MSLSKVLVGEGRLDASHIDHLLDVAGAHVLCTVGRRSGAACLYLAAVQPELHYMLLTNAKLHPTLSEVWAPKR